MYNENFNNSELENFSLGDRSVDGKLLADILFYQTNWN